MRILIVTMPDDPDARMMRLALTQLGQRCDVFYSVDFAGGAEWSYEPGEPLLDSRFRRTREVFRFADYKTVWMRRPCNLAPRPHLEEICERGAAESESQIFINAMLRNIEHGCFTVNRLSPTRIATEKPYQFTLAQAVGLRMPSTLISNCRERIIEFFNRCDGKIVYKPLVAALWKLDKSLYRSTLTTAISSTDVLEHADMHSAPGIYQRIIDKADEVRVTVLGRTLLAVEKRFPHRAADTLSVDWRPMQTGAQYRPCVVPEDVGEKCIALLRQMGLVMGCFDFAVDAAGEYYFLEVNPQGQFLCYDHVCPELNHLEAMAMFLASGDADFVYQRRNQVRLHDVDNRELHTELEAQERAGHFSDLHRFRYGSVAFPLLDEEHMDKAEFATADAR